MSVQEIQKDSCCRLCVKDIPQKSEIYPEVLKNLNTIFNLEICDEDSWPKGICAYCREKSEECINFFRKIKEGEEKLLEIFGEKFQDVKKEVIYTEELPIEIKQEVFEDEPEIPNNDNVVCSMGEELINPTTKEATEASRKAVKSERSSRREKTHPKRSWTRREHKEEAKKMTIAMVRDELVRNCLGFKCDICSHDAKSYRRLRNHFLISHGVKGYMICCFKKFTSLGRLASHLKLHADPEAFKCSKCSRILSNLKAMRRHMRTCSKDPKTFSYICEVCSQAFPSSRALYVHRRKHAPDEEKLHRCTECSRRFLTPSELKYHRIRLHEKAKSSICDICGKGFGTKSDVEWHVKTTHLKKIPKVSCDRCGNSYSKKNIYHHLKRCQMDPVTCGQCGKELSNEPALKRHIKNIHEDTEKKTYPCGLCEKSFLRKSQLVDHSAKHSNIPPYQCSYCDMKFYACSTKQAHQRAQHPIENAAAKIKKPSATTTDSLGK
ncbi:zinc finger protein 567-like [Lutzomyia longipalpis]|uniref:zinc finger protein 567-like n=1 Tax=Lutzomyia longipalpis TaxID=7200 RepID=UPI0024839B21|nr:zinc finger protein 567-like [Lutzomyia longipalpis]